MTNVKFYINRALRILFPNRRYKDALFRRVFQDKKDLLDLYNALNQTDYSDPNQIEITTLEDVIYMSMKDDLSFIIASSLNLYEHQTTNIISITPKPLTAMSEPEYVYRREETVRIIDNRGIERFKVIQADDK